ncbi:Ku protein [Methylocapsa palsarum]|uniref:Non-homologous end joining protein Ku n=1 Tax=Methylocapsa palsarum TaxID=1612308 RepID=A0A1I4A4Z9_9HYPH|nr:Ku protein [Methylocapsa palsarum]SFK51415.1 DNA end-binding protein Ku [Methylocapsa palsarum]
MAPSRPYWKGYLKLSLVSCPIALYSAASSTERVAFKQINRKTGNRLKQQMVDEETGEVVETADKGRGFEIAKNTYVAVDDEDIDAIAIESNHTIDIDSFVPRVQIDERFLESPYYLVPDDRVGQDAFAVIREAMRGKGMVAIGRVTLAKRERVMMLQPWDKGLLGVMLRFAYEIRDASLYFGDLPDLVIPPDMLKLAEHILDSKTADFEPSQFKDRYEEAMVAMLRSKQAGAPAKQIKAASPENPNVINLMEALKRSLAAEPKTAPPSKSKKPRRKMEGQGEMLLPITGKGPPKAAAPKQPAAKPRTSRKAG